MGPRSAIFFFGRWMEPRYGLYLHEAQELGTELTSQVCRVGQRAAQQAIPINVAEVIELWPTIVRLKSITMPITEGPIGTSGSLTSMRVTTPFIPNWVLMGMNILPHPWLPLVVGVVLSLKEEEGEPDLMASGQLLLELSTVNPGYPPAPIACASTTPFHASILDLPTPNPVYIPPGNTAAPPQAVTPVYLALLPQAFLNAIQPTCHPNLHSHHHHCFHKGTIPTWEMNPLEKRMVQKMMVEMKLYYLHAPSPCQ